MSTAEKLLHEAQYAFQCISFGESSSNSRNRRRASALSRKIIRKYPGTMEAGEALALLRRLGEESYASNISAAHRHISEQQHHDPIASVELRTFITDSPEEDVSLDWAGLLSRLVSLPRAVLAIIAFAGFFLFGIFGPFLFLPLLGLVLFTGPLRRTLGAEQQRAINASIHRINLMLAGRDSSTRI